MYKTEKYIHLVDLKNYCSIQKVGISTLFECHLKQVLRPMKYPHINILYKYYRYNEHSLHNLTNKSVWFSTPKSFNDPFDCALSLDDRRMEESINQAINDAVAQAGITSPNALNAYSVIREEDEEAYRKFRDAIYYLFQSIGILSLSEVYDDILMWAHYAQAHTGFCMGYHRTSENFLGKYAEPVIYQRHYPSLSAKEITDTNNNTALNPLWLTKSEHWRYEREWWRVLQPKGNKEYNFPCNIATVIFGMRMKEGQRNIVRDILKSEKNVKFKEAIKSTRGFMLEVVDL